MARLFGYPINLEPDEEERNVGGGGSSTNAEEASRSATQPERETNPYPRFHESGSAPMDSESDLHNSFIDFFGRESREIETAGAFDAGRNQMQRAASCDVMEVDGEIELGLGIGARAGSGQVRGDAVTGDNKETDSGRGEVGADLNNHLFCEEEAMLMADDDVLFWENLADEEQEEAEVEQEEAEEEQEEAEVEQEQEEEEVVEEAEEEEEEVSEVTLPPVNNDGLGGDIDDIMMGFFEGLMEDEDYEDFHAFFSEPGVNNGDYHTIFPQQQPFNQHPPPPPSPTVMGTRPASKRAVDDLPVVEITSEELSSGRIVCAVCIGDVVVREKVTRLPCGHYYHGGCIVPWLGVKNTCPVCRYELPTHDLEYERKRRSQRL